MGPTVTRRRLPGAINPSMRLTIDYPAQDLRGQVKSFSPPDPSHCNSPSGLSGSRPCSAYGLCGNPAVSEKVLYNGQIGAGIEQLCCHSVPELITGDPQA